ncbi:MAG: helix-turn-helix domain-containing protein [Endozoicomonas sp.]
MTNLHQDQDLLNTTETARYLGLNPRTLQGWRAQGYLDLPWVRFRRRVRYRWSDIQAFVDGHKAVNG